AHPGGEVGPQPVDVVLRGVEIDEAPVNADANADVEAEAGTHPRAECADRPDNVEPGVNGSVSVVLVSLRMAEHRQQTVALSGSDMAFVVAYDPLHLCT